MTVASQRLFRTVDGRVVPEGDPESAFLLAGVGDEIPAEFEHAAKAMSAPPNKAAKQPANK